jgi:hypothetical protein
MVVSKLYGSTSNTSKTEVDFASAYGSQPQVRTSKPSPTLPSSQPLYGIPLNSFESKKKLESN